MTEVLLYIERGRKTVLNKDSQYKNDMLNKMQDKMFHMLAVCIILYPCRIDESLEQSMKEKVTFDKLNRLQGNINKSLFFNLVFSLYSPNFNESFEIESFKIEFSKSQLKCHINFKLRRIPIRPDTNVPIRPIIVRKVIDIIDIPQMSFSQRFWSGL